MEESYRESAYRFYVTDALQNIPQNKYSKRRFYDIIYTDMQKTHYAEKSGDEIAVDIMKRAGLSFGG